VSQLEQGLPPSEVVIPLLLLEKEANVESIRSALLWQRGQGDFSSHWLIERSSSNFKPHLEQEYSYSGIFFPFYNKSNSFLIEGQQWWAEPANLTHESQKRYYIHSEIKNFGGISVMVIDVSDQAFDNEVVKSALPVLVDLWAPWCGPCRVVAPVIESLAGKYDGKVKFCRVNVDDSPQTAAKYGVMSIPTLMFFKGGEVVDTLIGAVSEQALEPKLDALL